MKSYEPCEVTSRPNLRLRRPSGTHVATVTDNCVSRPDRYPVFSSRRSDNTCFAPIPSKLLLLSNSSDYHNPALVSYQNTRCWNMHQVQLRLLTAYAVDVSTSIVMYLAIPFNSEWTK
ncbi:hypothetical protein PENSPDRAFT_91141 [Peniophora sp. CONT]|nr:hypothetical protein PENSPDRAFT_91141 [Peniophora sp. CONT]